jgi:hypothetical protein
MQCPIHFHFRSDPGLRSNSLGNGNGFISISEANPFLGSVDRPSAALSGDPGFGEKLGANYSHFGTSTLVWSPELKLAPRYNLDELGEISSEI